MTLHLNQVVLLAQIGDAHAVKSLTVALRDSNSNVHDVAANALAQIGDVRAVESLVATLRDSNFAVREAAAKALERIGWQPSQDESGGDYYIVKKEWDKCIKIGTPAVEPLIAALKNSDSAVRSGAAYALGQIGDARAVEPLSAALKDSNVSVCGAARSALKKIGWTPSDEEKYLMGILIESKTKARLYDGGLYDRNLYNETTDENAAKELGMSSRKTPANVVLDYLFKHPGSKRSCESFRNLFEDYAEIIIALASFSFTRELSGAFYRYSIDDCIKALENLCAIHTPVASNILHKVLLKDDLIEVPELASEHRGWTHKTLSFEPLRNAAKAELDHRGNPKHDDSAYLADGAWKLHETLK